MQESNENYQVKKDNENRVCQRNIMHTQVMKVKCHW